MSERRCKHLYLLSRMACPHGCAMGPNGVPVLRGQLPQAQAPASVQPAPALPPKPPHVAYQGYPAPPRNTLPDSLPRTRPPTPAARATVEALEKQIASIGGRERA